MVSDWQVWDQWGWGTLGGPLPRTFVPSWEPVQTGGLLELFHPIVGACVRGGWLCVRSLKVLGDSWDMIFSLSMMEDGGALSSPLHLSSKLSL